MNKAKKGDVVKFGYTTKLEDGTLVGTSEGKDPVEVKVGEGNVLRGLDNALEGMEPGESKTVEVPPDEGYGPYREELVLDVPRERVPESIDPQVGKELQVRFSDGRDSIARVTQVNEARVTLDANHPLAGKSLIVDVHLVEIV